MLGFFTVVAEMEGGRMRLPRIVDHIVLTEDGQRIQSLRAFFDYAEMVPAERVTCSATEREIEALAAAQRGVARPVGFADLGDARVTLQAQC